MNLDEFIFKNDIKQIYISNGIFHSVYPKIKHLNLKVNGNDNSLNTLFWGMFEVIDVKNLGDFNGNKWVIWSKNDSALSSKSKKYAFNFIKKQNVKEHLVYDDDTIKNLEKLNIKSIKILLNENYKLNIKDYINYKFQFEYFANINVNFYSDIDQNVLNKILAIEELSNENDKDYNFAILEKEDIAIITKFGLEGKIVFINESSNFPNCVYYSNYLELIKKIYYYSINNLGSIIKSSFIKFIKSNSPDKTIVYVPIWKRHYLLEKCIDSIKNQSVDVDILGVCSLSEDIEFCKSNNIHHILVNNNVLGQKFQFGMEFCKLFFPKNVIIMGSDDIMSENYVKMITEYDNFDLVGLKTWKVYDINQKQKLKLSYNHKISEKDGKEYWGNTGLVYKYNFNSEYYGFPKELLSESPYMIGAGRLVSYKYLNKYNWEIYHIFLKKYLDTNSLFQILVLNKASFKLLKNYDECITSLKDYSITMITPLNEYKNHKNIHFEIIS